MIKNQSFFSLFCALLLALVLGSTCISCDDMSYEPTPSQEKLMFPAEGGVQQVEIRSLNGKPLKYTWKFRYTLETLDSISPLPTRIDTMTNGEIKYTSQWAEFLVSKDLKHITITAKENLSETPRRIIFDAQGQMSSFIISCSQAGK